jgi:hypothetical protein
MGMRALRVLYWIVRFKKSHIESSAGFRDFPQILLFLVRAALLNQRV